MSWVYGGDKGGAKREVDGRVDWKEGRKERQCQQL